MLRMLWLGRIGRRSASTRLLTIGSDGSRGRSGYDVAIEAGVVTAAAVEPGWCLGPFRTI